MPVKLEFFSGEFVFLLEKLKQRVNGGRNAHKMDTTETKSLIWFFRKVFQVCEGGFLLFTIYFSMVDLAILIPTFLSSPIILGEPHLRLALDIFLINSRISLAILSRLDLH